MWPLFGGRGYPLRVPYTRTPSGGSQRTSPVFRLANMCSRDAGSMISTHSSSDDILREGALRVERATEGCRRVFVTSRVSNQWRNRTKTSSEKARSDQMVIDGFPYVEIRTRRRRVRE